MISVKSESAESPSVIDATSSKDTVYVRKNIIKSVKAHDDGTEYDWYEYAEEQWPRTEWEKKQIPELNSKVDTLMMLVLESEGLIR